MNGKVKAIFIGPAAKQPMKRVKEVIAIRGRGLKGDRYCTGDGSYNKGKSGKRQVTLMNGKFLRRSGFTGIETRRNFITEDVELMWLIGRKFQIGEASFRGEKYLDPCDVPSNRAGKKKSFKQTFTDTGAIVARVVKGGLIRVGDPIIPPPKKY